jgi:undecaprenyl-diphosphatase
MHEKMLDFLVKIDKALFAQLNGIHSDFFDAVMKFISGKFEWIPLYVLILAWIIYKFRWKSLLVLASIALLIVLSDQLAVQIKLAVERLRPCKEPDIRLWVHLVDGHCGGMYGFVSNHAANSFALAVFTALLFQNRYYTWFIVAWAAIVSYSRIYLGVHYPGDVICGAILGILLAFIVYRLYSFAEKRIYNNKKKTDKN